MAYRIKGVIRLSDDGDANLGIVTANSLVGKISSEAITEQSDGGEGDVTGADELLLYDTDSGDLLRVTVDEFIRGADIAKVGVVTSDTFVSVGASLIPDTTLTYDLGTTANRWRDLYLSGSTIDIGGNTLSTPSNILQYNGEVIPVLSGNDLSLTGELTATKVSASSSVTAVDFYGNGANLDGVPTDLGSLSDVEVVGVTDGQSLVYNSSLGEWEPGSPTLPPDAVLSSLNVAGIVTFGENMEIFTQSFQGTTNGTPTFITVDMSTVYKVESTLTVVLSESDYTQDTCWFYNEGGTIRAEKPNGTPVSLNTGPIPNPDIDVGSGGSTYDILYDSFGDQLSIRCDRGGGGAPDPISAKLVITSYIRPETFVP